MTDEEREVQALLGLKAFLSPGEAARVLGVTTETLRLIRRARPEIAVRFHGMVHYRFRASAIAGLRQGAEEQATGRAGQSSSTT